MVALCYRADHIYFHSVVCSSFFFSSPNLSSRRLDVCHTSTHGVALFVKYLTHKLFFKLQNFEYFCLVKILTVGVSGCLKLNNLCLIVQIKQHITKVIQRTSLDVKFNKYRLLNISGIFFILNECKLWN